MSNLYTFITSKRRKGNLVDTYAPLQNFIDKTPTLPHNEAGVLTSAGGGKFFSIIVKDGRVTFKESGLSKASTIYELNKLILDGVVSREDVIREAIASRMISSESDLIDFDRLSDFRSKAFKLSLNTSTQILPIKSYDGTTDLVISDNKNKSVVVNSGFSVTENMTYDMPDHIDGDERVYDENNLESGSILKMRYSKIPTIKIKRIGSGNAKVGNYSFYISYENALGDETDIVAESENVLLPMAGPISGVYNTGWMDMGSGKSVTINIDNIDTSYKKIRLYYSRKSSNVDGNVQVEYGKLSNPIIVADGETSLDYTFSGYEGVEPITHADINKVSQKFDTIKTQVYSSDRLILGNLTRQEENVKDLKDLALRFTPVIGYLKNSNSDEYSVQNRVGYHPGEIYRFNVVFINHDGTTTSAYDLMGLNAIAADSSKRSINSLDLMSDSDKKVLNQVYKFNLTDVDLDFAERKFLVEKKFSNEIPRISYIDKNNISRDFPRVFNSKGVVTFPNIEPEDGWSYAIRFEIPENVLQYISRRFKGYFFVRQKRVPLFLCQGFAMPVGRYNRLPFLSDNTGYFVETVADEQGVLTHDKSKRRFYLKDSSSSSDYLIRKALDDQSSALFIPEVCVNRKFFNQFFTGEKYAYAKIGRSTPRREGESVMFFDKNYSGISIDDNNISKASFQVVDEGVSSISLPLSQIDGALGNPITFSARAGNASEAWRIISAFPTDCNSSNSGCDHTRPTMNFMAGIPSGTIELIEDIAKEVNVNLVDGLTNYEAITIVRELHKKNVSGDQLFGALRIIYSMMTGSSLLGDQDVSPILRAMHPNLFSSEKNSGFIRGEFGCYVGTDIPFNSSTALSTETVAYGDVVNIYVQGYSIENYNTYEKLRGDSTAEFFAISDRYEATNKGAQYKFLFNGDCFVSKFYHRHQKNFIDPETPHNETIVIPNTIKDNMNTEKDLHNIVRGDVNAVKVGSWVSCTVRGNLNLAYRGEDMNYPIEYNDYSHYRTFAPFDGFSSGASNSLPESDVINEGFSTTLSSKSYLNISQLGFQNNYLRNRIIYSNINQKDQRHNGYRHFNATDFIDTPTEYGSITKLEVIGTALIVVLERGVLLYKMNERSVVSGTGEGTVYLQTQKFLNEKYYTVVSDKVGSQWIDSVISTNRGIYGVDALAKKIWRLDLTNGLVNISDMTVQSFLNEHLSFSDDIEQWLGVYNIATHYNEYKGDVIFTAYDKRPGHNVVWSLCFNEKTNTFTTFYSWVPSLTANMRNSMFSFDSKVSEAYTKFFKNSSNYKKNFNIYASKFIISDSDLDKGLSDLLSDVQGSNKWEFRFDLNGVSARTILKEDGSVSEEFGQIDRFRLLDVNEVSKDPYELKTDISWCISIKNREPGDDASMKSGFIFDLRLFLLASGILYRDGDGVARIASKYSDDPTSSPKATKENIKHAMKLWFTDKKSVDYVREPLVEFFVTGIDSDQYFGRIAITFEFLSKSGVAIATPLGNTIYEHKGAIDASRSVSLIKPTFWYGQQHPFEFEFVSIGSDPTIQKILTNLIIIGNSAEPESYHITIDGDGYNFSSDKANMYYRQEATKEFLRKNKYNVDFNTKYRTLHNPIKNPRSFLFNKEYERQDRIEDLFDNYYTRVGARKSGLSDYDFTNKTGTELIYDKVKNEYEVVNNQKANILSAHNGNVSRLRGNTHYKEDRWRIDIEPMYYRQTNGGWVNDEPQIIIPQSGLVSGELPLTMEDNVSILFQGSNKSALWQNNNWSQQTDVWSDVKSALLRDKSFRIRVRYDGKKLAVITAIQSLYTISFS